MRGCSYGLSLTSAAHGAFLIQLTTLIVPLAQGLQGVPIPRRVWAAIGLAVAGVALFTQDPGTVDSSSQGDALCVLAAIFYASYDLRLFHWGKKVQHAAASPCTACCTAWGRGGTLTLHVHRTCNCVSYSTRAKG